MVCLELDSDAIQLTGFPSSSVVKKLPASAEDARDADSMPGLGRSPGEGDGNSLQHSCLGNPLDGGAWRATVHGATRRVRRDLTSGHSPTPPASRERLYGVGLRSLCGEGLPQVSFSRLLWLIASPACLCWF